MAESCEKCRFGISLPGHTDRLCRRYPPVLYTIRSYQHQDGNATEHESAWSQPVMGADEWCGEYQEVMP